MQNRGTQKDKFWFWTMHRKHTSFKNDPKAPHEYHKSCLYDFCTVPKPSEAIWWLCMRTRWILWLKIHLGTFIWEFLRVFSLTWLIQFNHQTICMSWVLSAWNSKQGINFMCTSRYIQLHNTRAFRLKFTSLVTLHCLEAPIFTS